MVKPSFLKPSGDGITCGRSRQTVHLTARKTSPEDAAQSWWRNVEKRIQPYTTAIKPKNKILHNKISWDSSVSKISRKELFMIQCYYFSLNLIPSSSFPHQLHIRGNLYWLQTTCVLCGESEASRNALCEFYEILNLKS